MDLTKPPKNVLRPTKFNDNQNWVSLHPIYEVRKQFYERVLVPTGHARHSNDGAWHFSEEFLYELKHNIKFLQAWIKLL
jgi:hypothetical protein